MLVIPLNKKVLAGSCQHLYKAVISPGRALISSGCVSLPAVNPSGSSGTGITKAGAEVIMFSPRVAQIVLTFAKHSTTGAI